MSDSGGPRAAIIGAGLMGRWHADAVRRIGGRVTLIVDPREAARKALGRLHPKAALSRELDPASLAGMCTVAHVCTPLETHDAIVTAIVDASVHVLVEKPFAETAAATERMLSLAQERGVLACPVHQFLFQEGVRSLLASAPALGTLHRVDFSTCSAGAPGADARSLDGLVAEILPHPLAIISALMQMPMARVDWQVAHPAPGELRAIASVGAAVIEMGISAHGRPTENVLRVIGDAGSMTADLFHGYAVSLTSAISRRGKITQPFRASANNLVAASTNLMRRALRREPAYPGLRALIRAFYDAVESRGAPPISPTAVLDVALARDLLLKRLQTR